MSDPIPIKVELGIDVVSLRARVPAGAVREVVNIELNDKSGFRRRPGYDIALAEASSGLWQARNMNLALLVSGGQLWRLTDPVTGDYEVLCDGATELFAIEHAHWVYASVGSRVVRIDPDFSCRTAGVAETIGIAPTLTALNNGGLAPGKYIVAVSYSNDLGEESGISASTMIELQPGYGTIQINLPQPPAEAVSMTIYRTSRNGDELYRVATVPADSSFEDAGSTLGRPASNWQLGPIPAGMLASIGNHVVSAVGNTLFVTDDFNPNLIDLTAGYVLFGERICMVASVTNGLFVGTDSKIYFLAGLNPAEWTIRVVADNGAIYGSGRQLPSTLFADEMLRGAVRLPGGAEAEPVAVWLSKHGIQMGLFGGSVLTPQEERIALTCERASISAFKNKGIHQLLCATQGLNMGVGGSYQFAPAPSIRPTIVEMLTSSALVSESFFFDETTGLESSANATESAVDTIN